jgi:hypothetical protein
MNEWKVYMEIFTVEEYVLKNVLAFLVNSTLV